MQSSIQHTKFGIKEIAATAMAAAILVLAKFVIAALPNIEVVTLLIVCFASVFRLRNVLFAVLAFCVCDILIYGFMLDVTILYFVHYPLLATCAYFVSRATKRNIFVMILIVSVFATIFWLETPLILSLLSKDMSKFPIIAYFGIPFYIANICSNLASMLLYPTLCKVLDKKRE